MATGRRGGGKVPTKQMAEQKAQLLLAPAGLPSTSAHVPGAVIEQTAQQP